MIVRCEGVRTTHLVQDVVHWWTFHCERGKSLGSTKTTSFLVADLNAVIYKLDIVRPSSCSEKNALSLMSSSASGSNKIKYRYSMELRRSTPRTQ
jgi:hypothetical protein